MGYPPLDCCRAVTTADDSRFPASKAFTIGRELGEAGAWAVLHDLLRSRSGPGEEAALVIRVRGPARVLLLLVVLLVVAT